MKLCANCKGGNFFLSSFVPHEKCSKKKSDQIIKQPKNSNIKITLKKLPSFLKNKNGKIVKYYAADGVSYNDRKIKKQSEVYNRNNTGITKIKNNKIEFVLKAPKCYYDNGVLWVRHLHFMVEKNEEEWENKIFTLIVLPINNDVVGSVKLEENGVFVNKKGIDNLNDLKKIIIKEIEKKYNYKNKEEIEKKYNKLINEKKEKERKIIVNNEKLMIKLAKMGYENLYLYSP